MVMIWQIIDFVPTYFFFFFFFFLIYYAIIRKMLANKEMVKFQNFCDISLYFYYKLCHYRSTKDAY